MICLDCGERPIVHQRRQLCSRCYQRRYTSGTLSPLKSRVMIAREIAAARKAERAERLHKEAEARQDRLDREAKDRLDRATRYCEQLAEGLSLTEVARQAGVSRQRVEQCVKAAGLKHPRPRNSAAKGTYYIRRTADQARRDAMATVVTQLESRILKRGPDECWPWVGPSWGPSPNCKKVRYARILAFDPLSAAKKRATTVHRVVYMLNVGPIPDGMTVDHICFNPLCCNPAHLQLLTPSANSARKKKAPKPDRSGADLQPPSGEATSDENFTPDATGCATPAERRGA